jgi:hypothetical protein
VHPQLAKARFDKDLAGIDDELCAARGWTVFAQEFPLLDVGFKAESGKTLRLRLRCEDWNDQPPADGKSSIFNGSPHPTTGKPFICMRGTREYHTHSSHIGDLWAPLKVLPEFQLGQIVTQIYNGWKAGNP